MALHFGAAWVLALPLADGQALIGSASSIRLACLVMPLLPLAVGPLEMVGLGSAIPLGRRVHLYACLCFYPLASTFMGLGAEVFVPCLNILGIGKRLTHIYLSEQGI